MNLPPVTENAEVWIGFGLFALSEIVGMSKAKDNSLIQLLIHMGSELFPYEVKRREPATRSNRPRRRNSSGQFTSSRNERRKDD